MINRVIKQRNKMDSRNSFTKFIKFTCIFTAFFAALLILQIPANAEPAAQSPEGYWKTIDDKTNEVKSIVKIWKHTDGTLKGRVEKIFPKPGKDPNPLCKKCKGDKKDKPVLGMEFMWGFHGEGSTWHDGNILDPENGKTYHCQLSVTNGGQKLKVYGYVRVIFKIGRTQTWLRAKSEEI